MQIEESLDDLEKMNVTVLGTTGCGSPELANIHRENSSLRLIIYILIIWDTQLKITEVSPTSLLKKIK